MPSTRSQRPGERCPCPRERILDSSGRDGPFSAGDICLVQASIFEPYLQMLHDDLQALGVAQSCKSTQSTQTDPEDSTKIKKKIQKYLKEVKGESAGHLKKRPAVIGFLSNTGTATVFLMGTLEKGVNDTDPLPEAFAKFAIPVYTKSLVDTSSDHLHTVPEWHEQKPQWIFTIPIKTTTPSSDERWRCDPPILCTTTGYYLQAETLARLEQVHGEQDMTFKFEEQSKPNSTWDYAREIIRLYEVICASFLIASIFIIIHVPPSEPPQSKIGAFYCDKSFQQKESRASQGNS